MASDKFFLFRTEEVTEFSDVFSDTGDNLSVLAVSADQVSYISAKRGSVVIVFNNAGLYETFQGTNREALVKTRMQIACDIGEEFSLVKKITEFITNPSSTRRVLQFDAVSKNSSFKDSKPDEMKPLLPKLPVVMSTQLISDDPASTDLTQTTTTTIAGITFPAPSLMPIVDYNEETLPVHGQPVGAANNWVNSGSGGSSYDITNDTGTPTVDRDNGTSVDAVNFAASDNLLMANDLEITGAYTMYMVIGVIAYGSFGSSMFSNGATHIGFADAAGRENVNSEFWVRHDTAVAKRPSYMKLDSTMGGTKSYVYPDPLLVNSNVNTASFEGQQTYVFVLRRDKNMNLYLHNHTGDVVGYSDAVFGQGDFATDGMLKVGEIGTGFRGYCPRIGFISSDIGGVGASKLAKDLFDKYQKVF